MWYNFNEARKKKCHDIARVVFATIDSAGALARLVGGYPDLKYQVLALAKGLPRCAAISPGLRGRRLRCRRPPGRLKLSERLRFRFPATITLLRRGRSPRPTVCRRCSSRSETSESSSTAFHMTWCADGGGRWDLTQQRRGCWRRIWMCMRRNAWQLARRPLPQWQGVQRARRPFPVV